MEAQQRSGIAGVMRPMNPEALAPLRELLALAPSLPAPLAEWLGSEHPADAADATAAAPPTRTPIAAPSAADHPTAPPEVQSPEEEQDAGHLACPTRPPWWAQGYRRAVAGIVAGVVVMAALLAWLGPNAPPAWSIFVSMAMGAVMAVAMPVPRHYTAVGVDREGHVLLINSRGMAVAVPAVEVQWLMVEKVLDLTGGELLIPGRLRLGTADASWAFRFGPAALESCCRLLSNACPNAIAMLEDGSVRLPRRPISWPMDEWLALMNAIMGRCIRQCMRRSMMVGGSLTVVGTLIAGGTGAAVVITGEMKGSRGVIAGTIAFAAGIAALGRAGQLLVRGRALLRAMPKLVEQTEHGGESFDGEGMSVAPAPQPPQSPGIVTWSLLATSTLAWPVPVLGAVVAAWVCYRMRSAPWWARWIGWGALTLSLAVTITACSSCSFRRETLRGHPSAMGFAPVSRSPPTPSGMRCSPWWCGSSVTSFAATRSSGASAPHHAEARLTNATIDKLFAEWELAMKLFVPLPVLILTTLLATGCSEAGSSTRRASLTQRPIQNPEQAERRLAEAYPEAAKLVRHSFVAPGLNEGYVPQGLAWSERGRCYLVSLYHADHASVVAVLDKDGELTSHVVLAEAEGTPHRGHVGGITASERRLWVASSKHVYRYAMTDLLEAEDGQILTAGAAWRPDSQASHVTLYDGQLWVGDYARHKGHNSPYTTANHRHVQDRRGIQKYAWLAGYTLDATDQTVSSVTDARDGKVIEPDTAISVRQEVQGVAMRQVEGGTLVALSVSYESSPSRLAFYLLPADEASHTDIEAEEGRTIPLRFLDGENHIKTLMLPAGAEEITWTPDGLAVVFEAAAASYRDDWGGYLEDRILVLDVDEWLGVDIHR